MKENLLRGNLADTPFPKVLFQIWQEKNSGYLRIKKGKIEKKICFINGSIAGDLASFPVNDFLKALVKNKIINSNQIKKYQNYARQNKASIIKSLIELEFFSPAHLWQLMADFFKKDLFSLFDWSKAEYYFESENVPGKSQILKENQTFNLILQGIRQMKNYGLIEAHLPAESERIELLFPYYFNEIIFEPHEKYLLGLMEDTKSLKKIYDSSETGKRETQKFIFASLSLGIVDFPQKKEKDSYEFSSEELEKILAAFNSKCSYIYKYISKEIGPVALNVLSKCLDDIKPQLDPSFQDLELRPDGKIEVKSILKMNFNLSNEKKWKNLLYNLDEILAAEILAVKRTLGNAHETVLIENLEKIGDLS